MQRIKPKLISLMLILALAVGMVGVFNVDTTYAASKKIHVKKKTVSIYVGSTYQQKLIDKKGKTIKATKVKWKSKNQSVARISKKGKITAVKKGTAKMTAKYKGKTYKFTVNVKTVDPKAYTIGEKATITSYAINMYYKGDDLGYYANKWGDNGFRSNDSSIDNMISICKELLPMIKACRNITTKKYPYRITSASSIGCYTLDDLLAYTEDYCTRVVDFDRSKLGTLGGTSLGEYAIKAQMGTELLYKETYLKDF